MVIAPHFRYLFYTGLSIRFSVFLSVSFLVLVHLTFSLTRAIRRFSLYVRTTLAFFVICFVTGATFTDPLTCSFLIVYIFLQDSTHPSKHPHIIHLQSLFCLSLLTMSLRYTHMLWSYHYVTSPLASQASFCHTTLDCTSSNFLVPLVFSLFVGLFFSLFRT